MARLVVMTNTKNICVTNEFGQLAHNIGTIGIYTINTITGLRGAFVQLQEKYIYLFFIHNFFDSKKSKKQSL